MSGKIGSRRAILSVDGSEEGGREEREKEEEGHQCDMYHSRGVK